MTTLDPEADQDVANDEVSTIDDDDEPEEDDASEDHEPTEEPA